MKSTVSHGRETFERLFVTKEEQARILSRDPLNTGAMLAIARCDAQMGSYAQAEEHITRALTANPDLSPAVQLLAEVYIEWGRVPQALAVLKTACQRFPSELALYRAVAHCLQQQQRSAECIELSDMIVVAEPENIENLCQRGKYHQSFGNLDLALSDFKAASELDPWNSVPVLLSARLEAEMQNWAEAASTYKRVIALNRNEPEPHFELAHCYRKLGMRQDAQIELHIWGTITGEN